MKKPHLQIAALVLLVIWSLGCQLCISVLSIGHLLRAGKQIQPAFVLNEYGDTIQRIDFQHREQGLRRGDELVKFNGAEFEGEDQLDDFWRTSHAGDKLALTVKRQVDGKPAMADVTLTMRSSSPNAVEWLLTIVVSNILPLSCLLVGFYIAFARPRDPLAWITMVMLASFGQVAGNYAPSLLVNPLRNIVYVYQLALNTTWPLWMVLFSFYFPIPFAFIKRHGWISWILALPCMVLGSIEIYGAMARGRHIHQLSWLSALEETLSRPEIFWFGLYVCAFFFFLGWKRHIVTQPDARRRLRLMSIGCSISLLPTLPVFLSRAGIIPHMPFWLFTACLSLLVFFPITMAYVIVVQRAMDVRMVLRTGVKYALASNGVRIITVVIMGAVVTLTIKLASRSDYQMVGILIGVAGFFLVVSLFKLNKQARTWVDRRFFREAYNAEMLLTDLSSSVAGIRDTKVLLETVAKRISESMHVPRIAVFLDRGGVFQPAYALGFPAAAPPVEFAKESGVVRLLKRQRTPYKIYFEDPQSWVHGVSEPEQKSLRQIGAQLVLPVSLKNRLLGIISLGSKRSEEPYTRADIQLLNAVASQTGLALENAELTESVRREIAQRVRLDRELEIAREVQQRLFPQKLPLVNGLDFAGYCRPAEGVGGDYYDFIHLPDGCLGIAVGDVSGKGIAAALMMASLQASLRGQTIRPCEKLSEIMGNINNLVFDASASNRYATFFYAQYDPSTLKLRYVNAGHNPPLVWRGHGSEQTFVRLEEGGTVVGLFPDFPFAEATVQLEKGDVVVAYTDGISEAMTASDEEYGEERLIEALRRCQARSAADISSYVLGDVDTFTAGAKQNDDMTLVILRVH
jgi:sigma-B regulation protein RsbU (phosphoserine phosphatase)